MTTATRGGDLAGTLLGQIRFGESALKAWQASLLIFIWFYSLFFRPLFPTRVILALVGDKGSGKTTLLKRMGRLIVGSKFEVTDISEDAKDLDAALTSQPFVVIDNADRAMPWLDDKLAIAATGGSIKRRILYTTNKLAEFPIVAWVGITSRTPHFRREDVADRLLLINVERFDSFTSANHLDDDIECHRDALMTEVVYTLQSIVAELQKLKDLQVSTTFRMADFAEFAVKIGPIFGVNRDEVEQMLRDLATVQLEFTSVDEPLLLHVDAWLSNTNNISRWVSTKELFDQLHGRWRVARPGTFPWRDPKQLGQHITSLRSTLVTHYDFDEKTAHAGTRHVRFNKSSRR
jgi:energy-coupling factor transporter ATP-binding protein EcfA2